MVRLPRFPVLLFALVALTACGDDGGNVVDASDEGGGTDPTTTTAEAEASPFDRDPSELLPEEQIEEVLGAAVTSESAPGDAATSTPSACLWSAQDQTIDLIDPRATGLTVFLGDELIYQNTQLGAETTQTYEEIDGLGDAAFAGDSTGGVLVGEVGATVTPIGVNTNDPATHDLIVILVEDMAPNV